MPNVDGAAAIGRMAASGCSGARAGPAPCRARRKRRACPTGGAEAADGLGASGFRIAPMAWAGPAATFCLRPRHASDCPPADCPRTLVDAYLTLGVAALFALLIAAAAFGALLRQRLGRRTASVNRLLELADRLEGDLKACRNGLRQAHAVMSLNPDLPAASEQDARHAVDAGLQALLRQRIWIRDRAARASQQELDETAAAMHASRDRLQPLLQALNAAQRDLDSAMREHIHRDAE